MGIEILLLHPYSKPNRYSSAEKHGDFKFGIWNFELRSANVYSFEKQGNKIHSIG
jgi:hypothetical protein